TFTFPGYNSCDSSPQPILNCVGNITQANIPSWAGLLDAEVQSVKSVWPTARVIVMGHSQGGLIAYTWWDTHPTSSVKGFSLDSPINGACLSGLLSSQTRPCET